MPGLLHPRPLVHAQKFELHERHPTVACEKLIHSRKHARHSEQFRFEHPGVTLPRVERVEHHATGPAFGKRQLILVDKSPLERKRHQHAEDRNHRVPHDQLPPRHDAPRHQHVRTHARNEGGDHIARRRRDRLRAVVLQNREIFRDADARQPTKKRERQNHRRQAHADTDARFSADVERRRRQDAAEQKARDRRADGELRQIAAINIFQPPAVFLRAGPGLDLFVGQLRERHGVTEGLFPKTCATRRRKRVSASPHPQSSAARIFGARFPACTHLPRTAAYLCEIVSCAGPRSLVHQGAFLRSSPQRPPLS